MHADIHLLSHRTSAAEARRRAAAAGRAGSVRKRAGRAGSVRKRAGRALVVPGLRLGGPTDLTVTLAA